jgi:hypothetical protein
VILSPALTWLFYVGGAGLVFTLCAAIADYLLPRLYPEWRDEEEGA